MRLFALIPTLLSAAALVITFLCLFAGRDGFMDDYNLFTLNISRIGSAVTGQLVSDNSILPTQITDIFNSLPADVQNTITNIGGEVANSFAGEIGLEDYYTAHIMNYCYGDYTPSAIPTDTVSQDDIEKDRQGCTGQSSDFWFDPRVVLQESLDRRGITTITVDDLLARLNWPEEIDTGLNALRIAYRAMFALYVISIILLFIMFLTSVFYIFSSGSRIIACLTIIVSLLTFVASGAASGIATAINIIGTNAVNNYGDQVGVEAQQGRSFLVLTWIGTAVVFIGLLYWFVDCCVGRSKKVKYHSANAEKGRY